MQIANTKNVCEFYHSSIWTNNGIIYIKYKPDVIIDLKVAREIVSNQRAILKGISKPAFIDVTEMRLGDIAARKYLIGDEACEFLTAIAIYSNNNKLMEFVGKASILLDHPAIPARVFSDETKALAWLTFFTYSGKDIFN